MCRADDASGVDLAGGATGFSHNQVIHGEGVVTAGKTLYPSYNLQSEWFDANGDGLIDEDTGEPLNDPIIAWEDAGLAGVAVLRADGMHVKANTSGRDTTTRETP